MCGIAVIQLLKGTPFKESKVLLNLFERIFGSYFLVAVAAVEVLVLVPEEELITSAWTLPRLLEARFLTHSYRCYRISAAGPGIDLVPLLRV